MRKVVMMGILLIPIFAYSQYGIWDRAPQSTYTPLSPNDILGPAMQMRQRADNNAAKIDQLIDWIFSIKRQSIDQQLSNALDTYYHKLQAFYEGDLARMDNQIRSVKRGIQEEIDKYNQRVRDANINYNRKIQEEQQKIEKQRNEQINSNAYLQRAESEIEKEDFEAALISLNKAIVKNENNVQAYYMKGCILMFVMNNYDSAIACFSNCIYKEPNAHAYFQRGICYEITGNYKYAEIDYSRALTYNPNYLEAYYRRGIVKSGLDDRVSAISDYDYIINFQGDEKNQFKDFATVYNNKAYCLVKLGYYDEALPLVNKALDLDKNLAYIWDTRGELYFYKGLYEKCIEDMNKAISIQANSNSYYYRGLAKIKINKKQEACKDLQKALELGKTIAENHIQINCK